MRLLLTALIILISATVIQAATPADEATANAAISHYSPKVTGKTISEVNRILETSYDRKEKFGSGTIYYYCFTATVCLTAHFNSGKCVSLGMSENY